MANNGPACTHRLLIWASALVCAAAGCTSPGGGGGGSNADDSAATEDNGDPNVDGGPSASPRADGATILYSPYSLDSPEASAQNAAFSPDGSRIVFTLFANGYNRGPAELWIVNVDGSDPQRLTSVEDQDNVCVPGGAWNAVRGEIVFASDRDEADDIWAIRPDGTGLRRITEHVEPPYWIEPVWSPDGEWIVFESDTDAQTELTQRGTIYKVRADGSELTQLTKRDSQDFDDRLPNWSPDGELILFQRRIPSGVNDGDNWDIYVVDTDGDDPVNVSNAAEYFNTDCSWSPDSGWIASSSSYSAGGDELAHSNIIAFFLPDPDSNEDLPDPVRITFSDEHEDGAPSVSPDGRWVTFESHRTEEEDSPSDIWIIETPDELRP